MVDFVLTVSKFTYLLSATLCVGYLLVSIFFAQNFHGEIRKENLVLRRNASLAAWFWFASSSIFIIATLASVLDVPITQAFDLTTLRSFVTQISLGKFLAIQSLGALLVAIWVARVKRITYASLILILALISISAPIFQSHSSSGGSHLMAIGTLWCM